MHHLILLLFFIFNLQNTVFKKIVV